MQESYDNRGVKDSMEIIDPIWGYFTIVVLILLYMYAEDN